MKRSCRERLRKEFDVYDETLDIVSSWESVLSHSYKSEFENFYFDRFPSIDHGEENPLIPDFTVFFSEEYGIIGEIKRTFPKGETEFRKRIQNLKNYDGYLPIEDSNERKIVPDTIDLLVIISGTDAPQIGTRLNRILNENEEFEFQNPPVLVRYQLTQTETFDRYDFQRVTQLESEFRDEVLPNEDSISNHMGEEGDYGTLKVLPTYFGPEKIKKPICNDEPPGHHLSTFLWHKIFPEYLSRNEFLQWQMGQASKTIPIEESVDGITERINEYIQEGKVRRSWIKEALDFLCGAELAEKMDEDDVYKIKFRGLVKNVGSLDQDESVQFLNEIRELGTIFINRYCKYTGENEGATVQTNVDDWS